MNSTPTDRVSQLSGMIQELIEILRYENDYAFRLLQAVTQQRETVIELDGHRVFLKASKLNSNYILVTTPVRDEVEVQFSTSGYTLRRIIAGVITIDHAVARNEIFVKASFGDLLNIYRLAITLLVKGPHSNRLRTLWMKFNDNWENNIFPISTQPFEEKKVIFNLFIQTIPIEVLRIQF